VAVDGLLPGCSCATPPPLHTHCPCVADEPVARVALCVSCRQQLPAALGSAAGCPGSVQPPEAVRRCCRQTSQLRSSCWRASRATTSATKAALAAPCACCSSFSCRRSLAMTCAPGCMPRYHLITLLSTRAKVMDTGSGAAPYTLYSPVPVSHVDNITMLTSFACSAPVAVSAGACVQPASVCGAAGRAALS
jgi:hypothetical protein